MSGGFSGAAVYAAEATATIAASMGGFGGAGNRAGDVAVTSNDNIIALGKGASGIVAQSIGGGGGMGG